MKTFGFVSIDIDLDSVFVFICEMLRIDSGDRVCVGLRVETVTVRMYSRALTAVYLTMMLNDTSTNRSKMCYNFIQKSQTQTDWYSTYVARVETPFDRSSN